MRGWVGKLVHTSNCHGQNCTVRAIFTLGIDTLIADILVINVAKVAAWRSGSIVGVDQRG